MIASIQNRLAVLEQSDLSYDQIFIQLCTEFELDSDHYSDQLGCQCPYGLIGFLMAE